MVLVLLELVFRILRKDYFALSHNISYKNHCNNLNIMQQSTNNIVFQETIYYEFK